MLVVCVCAQSDSDSDLSDDSVDDADDGKQKKAKKAKKAKGSSKDDGDDDEHSAGGSDGEDDDDDGADGAEDSDSDGDGKRSAKAAKRVKVITRERVEALLKGAFEQKTMRPLVKLVSTYRSACHAQAAVTTAGAIKTSGKKPKPARRSVRAEDESVFDLLLRGIVDGLCVATWHHLGVKAGRQSAAQNLGGFKDWKRVSPLIKAFLTSTLRTSRPGGVWLLRAAPCPHRRCCCV